MRRLIAAAALLFTLTAAGVARDSREGDQTSQPLLVVLDELRIPLESQVAVFSPTSLQGSLVSPENPRVIYFNDRAAVAWVRGGTSLEIIDFSSAHGPEFYTLDQSETTRESTGQISVRHATARSAAWACRASSCSPRLKRTEGCAPFQHHDRSSDAAA